MTGLFSCLSQNVSAGDSIYNNVGLSLSGVDTYTTNIILQENNCNPNAIVGGICLGCVFSYPYEASALKIPFNFSDGAENNFTITCFSNMHHKCGQLIVSNLTLILTAEYQVPPDSGDVAVWRQWDLWVGLMGGLIGLCCFASIILVGCGVHNRRRMRARNEERKSLRKQNGATGQKTTYFSLYDEYDNVVKDADVLDSLKLQPWFISNESVAFGNPIASGGEGIIHSGRWNGQMVAIKSSLCFASSQESFNTFKREIETFRKLRCMQIITFYGVTYTDDFGISLILEYSPRGSLHHVLHEKSTKPLTGKIKCRLLKDICYGMSYLHSKKPPLIHRDLKTGNVLVTAGFHAKITDFGLTTLDTAQHLTKNIGTASYTAPEVFESQRYSVKVDVYSFGILFWEMMEEEIPYSDFARSVHIVHAMLSGRRPTIPEKFPAACKTLMVECWNGDPSIRPTFEEILARIEEPGITKEIVDYVEL